MQPQLYIIGDVHHPSGGYALPGWLHRLAERPTPARLVVLGDLVDYWVETGACVEQHGALLGQFRALAAAGWRIDLVPGNRELVAGRRLATAMGAQLHWPNLDLQLGDRLVRIVHGDRLCHDPGYHAYAATMRSFWIRVPMLLTPAPVQDAIARWLRVRSRQKALRRRRGGASAGAAVEMLDPRRIKGSARGADVLVGGHIHVRLHQMIAGVELWLVGDWPSHEGTWLEGTADGRLTRAVLELPARGAAVGAAATTA